MLAPVVAVARRGSSFSWYIGGASLAAAITILTVLALSSPLPIAFTAAFVVLLGLAGILPSVVLFLFGFGLRRLGALPDEFLGSAKSLIAPTVETESTDLQATGAPSSTDRGIRLVWKLARYLFRIRDVIVEGKARWIEAGLLLRIANPSVLLAVLASLVAAGVLIPLAGLTLLAVLLF
jgi:hypothetical protein